MLKILRFLSSLLSYLTTNRFAIFLKAYWDVTLPWLVMQTLKKGQGTTGDLKWKHQLKSWVCDPAILAQYSGKCCHCLLAVKDTKTHRDLV